MPEMPEIEAFKSYIDQHCLDKKIVDVAVEVPRILQAISVTSFKNELLNSSFSKVDRLGKYLVITLMPTKEKLVIHFALTGSLRFVKNKKTPIEYSAITYFFKDGSALHFTSIRKFEKTWLVKDTDTIPSLRHLGIDVLSINLKELEEIIKNQKSKNIKALMLDQKIIAGIGNEYADEILYQAGLDPHHSCKDLSLAQIKKLHTNMLKVIKHAIKIRVKASHTVGENESPLAGEFTSQYLQYHRHTDGNCPKNSNHKLQKAIIAGRTTYYCPEVQK